MKKNRRSVNVRTVVSEPVKQLSKGMEISPEVNIGEDGWAEKTVSDNPIFAVWKIARSMVGVFKGRAFQSSCYIFKAQREYRTR